MIIMTIMTIFIKRFNSSVPWLLIYKHIHTIPAVTLVEGVDRITPTFPHGEPGICGHISWKRDRRDVSYKILIRFSQNI